MAALPGARRDADKGDALMFCPPGYMSAFEVAQEVYGRAEFVLRHHINDERRVAATGLTLLEHSNLAVCEFLWGCSTLSVCSASGQVLRVSAEILSPSHSSDRLFAMVDEKTWLIRCEAPEDASDMTSGESTDEYEMIGRAMEDRMETRREVFHVFHGRPVVVHQSEVPKNARRFDRFLRLDEPLPDDDHGGRPSKQAATIEAYTTLFPAGHEGAPWKVVISELSRLVPGGVSERTIRRVLAQRRRTLPPG